jgi:hypothetical protein
MLVCVCFRAESEPVAPEARMIGSDRITQARRPSRYSEAPPGPRSEIWSYYEIRGFMTPAVLQYQPVRQSFDIDWQH